MWPLLLLLLPSTHASRVDDDFAVPVNRERWQQLRKDRVAWHERTFGKLYDKNSSDALQRDAAELVQTMADNQNWKPFRSDRPPVLTKLTAFLTKHNVVKQGDLYLRSLQMEQDLPQLRTMPSAQIEQVMTQWTELRKDTVASQLPPYIKAYICLRAASVHCGEGIVANNRTTFKSTETKQAQALEDYQAFLDLLPAVLRDKDPTLRLILAEQWIRSTGYLRVVKLTHSIWFEKLETVLRQQESEQPLLSYLASKELTATAWEARGGGTASTVTDTGYKKFKADLEIAKEQLEKGWTIAQKLKQHAMAGAIAKSMLTIGMGLGFPRDEEAMWFQRAMRETGGNFEACEAYFLYLEPKWHGSPEEIYQFADACLGSRFYEENIPWIFFRYVNLMSTQLRNSKEYLSGPDVWPHVERYFADMEKVHGPTRYLHSHHLKIAMYAHKHSVIEEQLKKLNDAPFLDVFTTTDEQYLDRHFQRKIKNGKLANAAKLKSLAGNPGTSSGNSGAAGGNPKTTGGIPSALRKQQAEAATYKLARNLSLRVPGMEQDRLLPDDFCLLPDGVFAIIMRVSRHVKDGRYDSFNELRLCNKEGQMITVIPLTFVAKTITLGPDQRLYVAGNGRLAVFSQTFQQVVDQELKHFDVLYPDKQKLEAMIQAENKQGAQGRQQALANMRKQLEDIRKIPEDQRTDVQNSMFRSLEEQVKLFESGSPNSLFASPADRFRNDVNNVYSALVVGDTLYLGSTTPGSRQGDILWAFDLDGTKPRIVMDKLRTFVNSATWREDQGQLVGGLSQQKLATYTMDGRKLKEWSYRTSEATPLSLTRDHYDFRISSTGDYCLMDLYGTIVAYQRDGTFKQVLTAFENDELVNRFCLAPDGTIYILDLNKQQIRVMEPRNK